MESKSQYYEKVFVVLIITAILTVGLQSCSKPNPQSVSEIVLETVSIYKSGGDYLGYIEGLEKKYKCKTCNEDSLKFEVSPHAKVICKMFISENEKVRVLLAGNEDSNWREFVFLIYPLPPTSESYSVDKCYKTVIEKAKEYNVFYYSLYLYKYEVPNSVCNVKVHEMENPFFKGVGFSYQKK